MNYEFRTLEASEIECRVNQISDEGFTLLLYKDARCDMNLLDEIVGKEFWQRDHKEVKGNLFCGVSIYDSEKQEWVTKWDCGTESNTEKEKGEASDSFKRACVNWGIGRELYTAPKRIFVKGCVKKTTKGKLLPDFWEIKVSEISYNDKREISSLVITGDGEVIYEYGKKAPRKPSQIQPTIKPSTNAQSGETSPKKPIFKCAECDCEISKTVKEYSMARFNKALCLECQKVESMPKKKKWTLDEQNDDIPF